MFPFELNSTTTLELLERRHASELYPVIGAHRSNLREWLPWLDNELSEANTVAFIERTHEQLRTRNGFQTAIRWAGRVVGVVGHHRVDWLNRSTSLGYWLAENAQG